MLLRDFCDVAAAVEAPESRWDVPWDAHDGMSVVASQWVNVFKVIQMDQLMQQLPIILPLL